MKDEKTIAKELVEGQEKIFNGICEFKIKQYLYSIEISNENSIDEEYQKNYIDFYTLSGTTEWKNLYFALLKENIREHETIESSETYFVLFKKLSRILYEENSTKEHKRHQFSFITKLLHTLNRNFPIYDSHVRQVLDLEDVYTISGIDNKIKKSIEIMKGVINRYSELEEIEDVKQLFTNFDNKFPLAKDFTNTKKLDYMLWVLGKIQLEEKENKKQQ